MHIVINGWFWGQTAAGSGQYLHHLLDQIAIQSPSTKISLLLPRSRHSFVQTLPQNVQARYISIPERPRHLAKLWWEQITVPNAARQSRADVLWVPYWAAPLWKPCPTVVTVHDLIHLLLPEYRGGLLNRLYTNLVTLTAQRSDKIITVSRASAEDVIAHLQVASDGVHPILNGIDGHQSDTSTIAEQEETRLRYGLPVRYFLYIGGFDVRKNLYGILSAYRLYLDRGGDPMIKLVVAGKLPPRGDDFFPDPKKRAAELNLTDQVHFCGWVSDKDKPTLYALSTALIFPSLYEGFGLPVVEAQAAGTAVITSADYSSLGT